MRIAISAESKNGLDSVIGPHFGRCPYFVLVDLDGEQIKNVQVINNPYYGNHQPGQVPAFIHSLGADVMLTGGMGGRAIMFFEQYNIRPVTGAFGTVRQSLERYLRGEMTGAAPCHESQAHGHGNLPAEGEYEHDEVGRLREEAEALRKQLDEIEKRLSRAASDQG